MNRCFIFVFCSFCIHTESLNLNSSLSFESILHNTSLYVYNSSQCLESSSNHCYYNTTTFTNTCEILKQLFKNVEVLDFRHDERLDANIIMDYPQLFHLARIKCILFDGGNIDWSTSDEVNIYEMMNQMVKLQYISLSATGLNSFDLDRLQNAKNLTYIDISKNSIEELILDFVLLDDLMYFNASFNNVSRLIASGGNVSRCGKLKVVDLSFNHLRSLPEDFITCLNEADYINFEGNQFIVDGCSFYPLWHLIHLFNESKEIVGFPEALTKPGLESCTYENCPSVCTCQKNKKIICSGKGLTFPPLITPSHVQFASFEDNRIENIDQLLIDECWINLKVIHLERNRLEHLENRSIVSEFANCSYHGLPKLEEIYLSWNNISSINLYDWKILRKAKTVNLRKNKLKNFDTPNETSMAYVAGMIENLDLSGNLIESLSLNFACLPFLLKLNVSDNKIMFIEAKFFAFMHQLHVLDLQDNHLEYFLDNEIDLSIHPFPSLLPQLMELNLIGNFIDGINTSFKYEPSNSFCTHSVPTFPFMLKILFVIVLSMIVIVCCKDKLINLFKKACHIKETPVELKYDLFIHYSEDDEDRVLQTVLPELCQHYVVGCTTKNAPGDIWVNIEDNIRKTKRFIHVISNASIMDDRRDGILRRLEKAQNTLSDFKCATLLIDECEDTHIHRQIRQIKFGEKFWIMGVKNFVGPPVIHPIDHGGESNEAFELEENV